MNKSTLVTNVIVCLTLALALSSCWASSPTIMNNVDASEKADPSFIISPPPPNGDKTVRYWNIVYSIVTPDISGAGMTTAVFRGTEDECNREATDTITALVTMDDAPKGIRSLPGPHYNYKCSRMMGHSLADNAQENTNVQ